MPFLELLTVLWFWSSWWWHVRVNDSEIQVKIRLHLQQTGIASILKSTNLGFWSLQVRYCWKQDSKDATLKCLFRRCTFFKTVSHVYSALHLKSMNPQNNILILEKTVLYEQKHIFPATLNCNVFPVTFSQSQIFQHSSVYYKWHNFRPTSISSERKLFFLENR